MKKGYESPYVVFNDCYFDIIMSGEEEYSTDFNYNGDGWSD